MVTAPGRLVRTNARFTYIFLRPWISGGDHIQLSTRYILGYQFSHLSSDSDFLPYSATFFLNLLPFAIWTKKVLVCHQFIRFSKLFLFLPLSFEGCEESAVALSYGGQMTFILWELIKLLFRSDSCIISDLSLALYNHLSNSNLSFKKY